MKRKLLNALFCSVLISSVFVAANTGTVLASDWGGTTDEAEEVSYGSAEDFAYEDELIDGALFLQLDWLEADVYSYTPSELYDPITSMMPIFYVYCDEPLEDINSAWVKLNETGLLELAETEHAAVFFLNPLNGETYGEEDYEQVYNLSQALTGTRDFEYSLPYDSVILKKLYVLAEGQGADFVANYLTNDIYSGMVSANVLINATSVPEEENYAIPAYLINCSDEVVAFYQDINETDTEDTVDGMTVFYNSEYVMDSGYTPKRVIIQDSADETLTSEITNEAWDVLLRRVWNDNLYVDYFTEGVECGYVSDRPIVEELDLTFNEISGEEAEGTGQSKWYEWVPNEVYETMENGTDETYALIVVMHGNGDHEIYEAESNGWVQLAGDERVIVVALHDIYERGFPPEAAETRYGAENTEFVLNVICEKYPVDMSRIYVAGFSIGGFVTADTAAAGANVYAAAACMAYPGDGYMQIFPYDEYDMDADLYDIPILYLAGRNDTGNSMVNPTDSEASRVLSAQLLFNQILTFNNMTDQLIDLVDFEYDWYPGEDDPKTDWSTGEATGGYDFWDGTAAAYITQNLDFETYPYYGFDVTAIPNTTQDTFVTTEGVEYERNIYYNDEGWPMLEHIVRGDMGHFHYTRDAQIIWNDLFSHYSRDPETGVLYYDGVAAGSSEVTEVSTDVEEAVAAEAETEIDFATLVNDAKQLLREDAETAVAELTQLYVMGSGEAAEKLGDAYKTGDGVEQDIDLAIEWYTKGGELGWGRCYSNIGRMYEEDGDYITALEYYDMAIAAETPDSKAARYSGLIYEEGLGVDADEDIAFSYFKISAELGDSTGKIYYANYLIEGRACEQDAETAIALYEEVVEAGSHDYEYAALALGDIYAEGVYVEADLEKAAEYYQIVLDCMNVSEELAAAAQEALDAM